MQNDKIKEYWEGEAGIYSEGIKAELKSETAENWKNLILEYAPEKEHLEVLDVGCGPGFFEIMLGKEGHHVTGIDITENMIHEAKEYVKAAIRLDGRDPKALKNTFVSGILGDFLTEEILLLNEK